MENQEPVNTAETEAGEFTELPEERPIEQEPDIVDVYDYCTNCKAIIPDDQVNPDETCKGCGKADWSTAPTDAASPAQPLNHGQIVKRETRSIMVPRDQEAIRVLGDQLADVVSEQAALEAEKSEVVKDYNDRIKGLEAKARELARSYRSGDKMSIAVDVCVEYDFDEGRVTVARCDTGEVLEDREMTSDEDHMQLELPLPLPLPPAPATDPAAESDQSADQPAMLPVDQVDIGSDSQGSQTEEQFAAKEE